MTKNLFMHKNITKILIALSALLFVPATASAQDPAFSQFYSNPLYLNPAFAGTNICPRVSLNYRDQWPGIGRTYVTTSALSTNLNSSRMKAWQQASVATGEWQAWRSRSSCLSRRKSSSSLC